MPGRRRYAQVGTGGRAPFFYEAIAGTYTATSELVAFCDVNQTRMDYANRRLQEKFGLPPVATYTYDKFDEMVTTQKPDVVIVTSIDRTHHGYIVRAMELGCDVISEIRKSRSLSASQREKAAGRRSCRWTPRTRWIRNAFFMASVFCEETPVASLASGRTA